VYNLFVDFFNIERTDIWWKLWIEVLDCGHAKGRWLKFVFLCAASDYILHVWILKTESVIDVCGLAVCRAWFEFC